MLETYSVSLGVAVRPIWVAAEKWSRISRQAESSAALPRWHSSITIRSKKSGRELPEQLLPLLGPGDRLVEAEVDLVRRVDPPLLVESERQVDLAAVVPLDGLAPRAELGHGGAERPEVVDHRLVDQDVPVGEEEDALLAARLPQPPDDLEGGIGLAGAGRHDQEEPVLALSDGFDRGVDGVDLVVARPLAAAVVVVVLEDHLLCLGRQALPGSVFRPERGRRRKLIEPEGGLPLLAGAGSIVEHEAIAVRREDEWDLKRLGILQRLLHARRRCYGCCPWPRSGRSECWACSRERNRLAWPCPG